MKGIPNKAELEHAYSVLKDLVIKTPVIKSEDLDQHIGAEIYLKCEHKQKINAFKFRGASFAISQLSEEQKSKGVATHSSGNHGAALAQAAKENNIPATIIMPDVSKKSKIKNVKDTGAKIIFSMNTLADREAKLDEVVNETGATFIPPYDDWNIISGQSTAAIELLREHPDLDIILCPVGGGGLISGTALAAHYFTPGTQVIGCEPKGADDAARSFKDNTYYPQEAPDTICDGLRTSVGQKNWEVIREYVEDILTVDDEEIMRAQHYTLDELGENIEVSSAVVIAVLFKHVDRFRGKKIGVIITGGNL